MLPDEDITTARLTLRRLKASDAPAMQTACADPRVALMTSAIPHPYPEGEAAAFIARRLEPTTDHGTLVRAIALQNRPDHLIGLISLVENDAREMEIGYWLSPDEWGQGLMQEAVRGLTETLFKQTAISLIVGRVYHHNQASARVLRTCGFIDTGDVASCNEARGHGATCLRLELQRERERQMSSDLKQTRQRASGQDRQGGGD